MKMKKQIYLEEVSKTILSKPYWLITGLQQVLGISSEELYQNLEILDSKYKEIGIIIDIVQLQSKEFIVTYLESNLEVLSNLQLALLIIIGLKTKLEIINLPNNSMNSLLNNYFTELQYLINTNYLEKIDMTSWSLTPLGVVTILPYIDNAVPLIQNLTKNE